MHTHWLHNRAISLALMIGLTTPLALAHDVKVGNLVIDHPYSKPTPPGATVGGGYIKALINKGDNDEQLTGARTPVAASVEIHQMTMQGDIMRMKEVSAITIPAKGKIELRHGGNATYHLMLMGLKAPLKDGDRFPITLIFKHAGEKEVSMWVQQPKDTQNDPAHKGH